MTASAKGIAHAKLIIIGEHFVVPYQDASGEEQAGCEAVAIPLPSLFTEINLERANQIRCELHVSSKELGFADNVSELMEKALRFTANRFQWDLSQNPLSVTSTSNFSPSRGLGSSASFSVALARAFGELTGKEADLSIEAQQIENLFHGKSSGLDTSAIVNQSPILFKSGKVLKTFTPVAVDFVVTDSGPREASSSLVSQTMLFRKNKPDLWKSLSLQVGTLAKTCLDELEKENGAFEVARILGNCQEILSQIGLSNSKIDQLLELGHKFGALSGKMSGAGAGGVVLFATHKGEGQALAKRLESARAKVVTIA